MDDGHSILINHTRAIDPCEIPLPPSLLGDYEDNKKGIEKREKQREPKELQHRNVDEDTRFWQTYLSETGKFDKELIESWNDNLNSLLLFAALFSAINTAFIIESYKRLQPDPTESTNSLLWLILAHRNDEEPISEIWREKDHWGPPSDAIRVNSTLFSSLACSLLASFGAILGKEMLAEYKNSGALNTLPEQGRTRQRKYDGLKRYRFRLLMQILPILLQLSLALFLFGIIDFLWHMSFEVAVVILIPVTVGFMAYVISVAVALRWEDSPFQTSLSKSLRLLFPTLTKIFQFLTKFPHNLRIFIVLQPPIMWNHIYQWAQPIKIVKTTIMKTRLWMRISSAFVSWMGILVKSRIFLVVRRCLREIIIASYICRLGIAGWFLGQWRYIDTGIWMSLKIGGLGIFGWFVAGWGLLVRYLGPSKNENWDDQNQKVKRDIVSSECVVWLLENSQDTVVLHKALETLPLLPADTLLRCFKAQPRILERYILMYNSLLQRRPGDVDFHLDGAHLKEAIASGTALFHVLKSRQQDDLSKFQELFFGFDPELSDAFEDVERFAKPDFSLLTVILCMQTQNGVGVWDFDILQRLLGRFLDILRDKSTMVESAEIAPYIHSESATSSTPSITLLLDAGIFMVSQPYYYDPTYSAIGWCDAEVEQTLATVHTILEKHPISMTLTSHIALFIAATQWFKIKDENTRAVEGRELEFNGVKLEHIRKAWFAVDKRVGFFDNIVLAFSLVTKRDSISTIKIYLDLLRLMEHFLPGTMGVSWKHREWNKWWLKVIQVIPGLLRLLHQVNLNDHPEAGHAVVRVISYLLPDDWDYQRAKSIINKPENAALQFISPFHPEHGPDMTALISSVLSSSSALASPQTRTSVAEILGWMIICPGVEEKMPSLINDPSGMYQQITTVPTLFMQVASNPANYTLLSFWEHYYKLFLTIGPEGLLLARVQLETLAIALANVQRSLIIFSGIRTLLHRMTLEEDEFSWPTTFVEPKLVDWVLHGEGSSQRRVLQLRVTDNIWEFLFSESIPVWSGEALMMLWRKLSNQPEFDANDFRYMFREDIILSVLDCLDTSIKLNCQVSCRTMEDYFQKTIELGWVGDELKARIDKGVDLLHVANTDGWDTLILKQISQNEGDGVQSLDQ